MEFPFPTHHSQESMYSSSFCSNIVLLGTPPSLLLNYSLPREPTKFLTQMFAILITGTIPCVQNIVANSSLPGIFSSSFAPTLFCCWVHLQHRYLPITKIIQQITHNQMSALCTVSFPSGQSIEFRCKLITTKNLFIVICSHICFVG